MIHPHEELLYQQTEHMGDIPIGTIFSTLDELYIKTEYRDFASAAIRLSDGEKVLFANIVLVLPIYGLTMQSPPIKNKPIKIKKLECGDTFIYNYHFFIKVDLWQGRTGYYDLNHHIFANINDNTKINKVDIIFY